MFVSLVACGCLSDGTGGMGPFGAVTVCVLAAGAWRGGHAWHCAQPCLGHCGGCCVSGFLWATVDGECAHGVSDHQNAEWCGAMLVGVVRLVAMAI